MKKYSDIKQPNKVRKVIVNRRHPHILTWEEMLVKARAI